MRAYLLMPLLGIAACQAQYPAEGRVLLVGEQAQVSRATEARAAWLLVRGLSAKTSAAMTEALSDLALRIESRVNPLSLDLQEGDPREMLRDFVSRYLPHITAARQLAQLLGRVRIGRRCAEARAGERCLHIGQWTRVPGDRHAQLASWPLAFGQLLTLASAPDTTIDALRRSAQAPDSRIALVLTERDLAAPPSANASTTAHRRLTRAAARVGRWLERGGYAEAAFLSSFTHVPSADALPGLGANEVLVVPRLGALAAPARIRVEIGNALRPTQLASATVRP